MASWGDIKGAVSSLGAPLWFIRGAASAWLVLTFVPADLTRYEFIRFIFAMMLRWNEAMRVVATAISSRLPALHYTGEELNSFLLLSIGYSSIAAIESKSKKPLLAFKPWFVASMLTAILALLGLYNTRNSPEELAIHVAFAVVFFALAVVRVDSFRNGVLSVVVLIAILWFVYAVNTPGLSDAMRSFADQALGPLPAQHP